MSERIMVIEDDSIICEELQTLLVADRYEVKTISDFQNVVGETLAFEPHLILLDINLPYEDGFSICTKLRSKTNAPIIFLTSRNTDMDELNSILLGGDAFITKPYHTAILHAKINSLLKRAYPNGRVDCMECYGVRLHLESGCLEYEGKKIDLTKNEQKILYYLMKHVGRICARADIIEFLWDNQLYVDDNTLSVNITRLREKLLEIGVTDFIKTKHRQGYLV